MTRHRNKIRLSALKLNAKLLLLVTVTILLVSGIIMISKEVDPKIEQRSIELKNFK